VGVVDDEDEEEPAAEEAMAAVIGECLPLVADTVDAPPRERCAVLPARGTRPLGEASESDPTDSSSIDAPPFNGSVDEG
jgi:hypothetical protein